MKKILFSVLALGAMTGVALAEPQKMSEAQLEGIAGGQGVSVNETNWTNQNAFALALGGGGIPVTATAANQNTSTNSAEGSVTSTLLPSMPNGNNSTGTAVPPPVNVDLPDIDLGSMGGLPDLGGMGGLPQ